MSSASLSLLKGANKGAVEAEIETAKPAAQAEPEAAAEEEDVVVDVDALNDSQLDALVEENEIEVPGEWKGWQADSKRAWLKSQFEDAPEGAEAEDKPEPATEPEAPKEEPKAKAGKTAKEKKEAKAKTPAKSKEVATSNAKAGEIMEPDILSDLVHEIENLKEKDARDLIPALSEQTELTMFRLGGVLSLIQANNWFEPYASFRDFVEKEHGLAYRKAMYWVGIYNSLSAAKVSWNKVKGIGWTKLKEIALVINEDNQDQWIEIALNSNTLTLIETVKKHLAKDKPQSLEDQSSKTVTTKTFKVHEDQKATIDAAIAKAKEQSSTTVDTVALEYICIDFLGGQTLEQKLKAMGMEAAFAVLEKAFPEANITVDLDEDADAA
ncbi:hypothetical protein [Brucella intermedia]|uniref:hypothetical protein n=1 Tax=Brucella intermedia TaxID=94625 RepID=UPI00224B9A44|nr:hypothetical protein [Brucella intermedia]